MQWETINEFIVLSRHLNFTAAAKELFITQPALSAHMASLEKEIGFSLFDRRKTLQLTEQGRMFLEKAKKITRIMDDAIEMGRAMENAEKSVRIATDLSSPELERALMNCSSAPFEIVGIDESLSFYEMLDNKSADILVRNDCAEIPELQRMFEAGEYVKHFLGAVPISLCTSIHNPRIRKGTLTHDDLVGATITVGGPVYFDLTKAFARQILGHDLDLEFVCDTNLHGNTLRFADPADTFFFTTSTSMHKAFANRDDVLVFDEVDGQALLSPQALYACSATPKNIEAFCGELAASYRTLNQLSKESIAEKQASAARPSEP